MPVHWESRLCEFCPQY